MRGTDRIAGQPDCGHDAAAYVLGALEPAEARAFARHLERCAICRAEVDALAPVLDALPASAPAYSASRGLRRRVLRAARAEAKQAPALRNAAAPRNASAPRNAPAPRDPPARRRRVRFPASALAACLALGLVLAFAVLSVLLRSSPSPERTIRATVGAAELRLAGGRGELIVDHLPAPAANRTYELWLVKGQRRPVPSTLFAVTSDGTADIGVPGGLHGLRSLLVTVEPRGGSLVPTNRAVIQLPLGSVSGSSPT